MRLIWWLASPAAGYIPPRINNDPRRHDRYPNDDDDDDDYDDDNGDDDDSDIPYVRHHVHNGRPVTVRPLDDYPAVAAATTSTTMSRNSGMWSMDQSAAIAAAAVAAIGGSVKRRPSSAALRRPSPQPPSSSTSIPINHPHHAQLHHSPHPPMPSSSTMNGISTAPAGRLSRPQSATLASRRSSSTAPLSHADLASPPVPSPPGRHGHGRSMGGSSSSRAARVRAATMAAAASYAAAGAIEATNNNSGHATPRTLSRGSSFVSRARRPVVNGGHGTPSIGNGTATSAAAILAAVTNDDLPLEQRLTHYPSADVQLARVLVDSLLPLDDAQRLNRLRSRPRDGHRESRR
jgi:hypothetical protein